jgi:phospholipase/carboxylesterase
MTYLQQEFDDRVVLVPGDGTTANACVIWLHGLGADGYDFVPIVPQLKLAGATMPRFVFPHAPFRPVTLNGGMRMRAWYDLSGLTDASPEDEPGIRESARRIEEYVRLEREAGAATQRIVLAGFSQGGAIALHVALNYPEPLGGVLALSAYLPLRDSVRKASSANRALPILMCHGLHDPVLALASAERSRDLLRARGYAVRWRTYPMEHQVCPEEIEDISRWLASVLAVHDAAT